jgi:hypothetical protein
VCANISPSPKNRGTSEGGAGGPPRPGARHPVPCNRRRPPRCGTSDSWKDASQAQRSPLLRSCRWGPVGAHARGGTACGLGPQATVMAVCRAHERGDTGGKLDRVPEVARLVIRVPRVGCLGSHRDRPEEARWGQVAMAAERRESQGVQLAPELRREEGGACLRARGTPTCDNPR